MNHRRWHKRVNVTSVIDLLLIMFIVYCFEAFSRVSQTVALCPTVSYERRRSEDSIMSRDECDDCTSNGALAQMSELRIDAGR